MKVAKTEISLYDSANHSLRDALNGTSEGFTEEEKQHKDFANTTLHQQNLKEVLQILLDLLSQKTTVIQTMLQKISEDVTQSFDLVKDNEGAIDNWIANEYPKEVLLSQLLRPLKEKKVNLDAVHAKQLQEWLGHPRIKSLLKEVEFLGSI